ncbi:MAG TPA: hypothetical protein VIK01_23175 [Polyangiaceae bacterium]
MFDSQPSASSSSSRPRNPQSAARRPAAVRRVPARQDLVENARWKVQLELAPAEIALVFRQGLARGAEVCRYGTQDWRPLVTTPELRSALAVSWPMLVGRRPSSSLSVSIAPPPPPVIKSVPPPAIVTRDSFDSLPDSAVTQPLPLPLPLPRPLPIPALRAPASEPPLGFTRPALHGRPFELSAVATLSVVATLVATLFVSRIQHAGAPRVALGATPHGASATAGPVAPVVTAHNAVSELGPGFGIPVVPITELPLEHGGAASKLTSSLGSRPLTPGSADRVELARALGRAARAASGCGPGPVNTQVVVTFAPSGVARVIHFAAAPPPAAMQSCVLNAVARSRVPAFQGPDVSVSKTLRW